MVFSLIFLIALLGVAVTVGAGLGLVAFMRQERLGRSLRDLQLEVARLRLRFDAGDAATVPPKPTARPEAAAPPVAPAQAAATPAATTAPIATGQSARGQLRWLEELAGGRLSVLLGGLALALGGVFTVRYTIEQGLLGPAGRIGLGMVLATAMAAGAEYLRRSDLRNGRAIVSKAYIPGALTAAAIVTAFATIYAAYGLYGFIGPAVALVLLALCSFAGLAVASLHGPGLAALGLAGSYATPLLIESNRPDAWLLFGYLLIVSFACFFTAHVRGWLWLAITASVAADAWVAFWLVTTGEPRAWALALYLGGLTACAVLLLHRGAEAGTAASGGDGAEPAQIDRQLTAMLAGHALMAVLLAWFDALSPPAVWGLIAISLILGWSGWSWRSLALAPAVGGIAVVLSYLSLGHPFDFAWQARGGNGSHWIAMLFGAGYGVAATAAFSERPDNRVWPCLAAGVPLALFMADYWLTTGFQSSLTFGLFGAILAITFAVVAETANHRPRSPSNDWGVAIFAAAAVAALALALAMVLQKGWLTVALAAMAPGLALIERERPIAVLRWLVAAMAGLVALRLLSEPSIAGGDPGSTPIFNWLLYAYGLPSLAFWQAARALLQRRDDLPVKIAEGTSIAFLAALIGMEIRHLMTSDAVGAGIASLGEYGLHTISWLGLAIGLRLRAGNANGRAVPRYAAFGFGGLGIVAMLGNTLLIQNPVFTGISVGTGVFFNDLLLAYLIPAGLAGLVYRLVKGVKPWWLPAVPGTAGLVMAFAYVTLAVGHWFEGPVIAMSRLGEGELYALSVVWLLFALGLLAAGIRFGNAVLRQAAFGVLLLVTLKVFLVDLAGLTGLLQAGSFIGLGVALIGIGLAYQRLVLRSGNQLP